MNRTRPKPAKSARRSTGRQNETRTAWLALIRVDGLIRRVSEPHFARYGLSPAQWGVLRSLSRLEESGLPEPRMHELGEALLVQPPSLSATLDRMVRAGLVVREVDPEDQRSRLIAMTGAARELLKHAVPDHLEWVESMMEGLTPAERRRLSGLLDKLSEHMTELIDRPTFAAPVRGRRSAKAPRSKR